MDSYVGQTLDGRYKIQEIIGVGGMAVVYKAYDNIDDRTVAVKILKEEFLANEEFRRRFKNESKAIAVLSHPNIVKVYDVSFGETLPYIVMEYVEGITLKEYIEQQKVLPWPEAVNFTTQILRALQHAHDKGIVHRDIKPQNIMLLKNGTIKVTDFGIARFSRGETRTMTESAIGSVHYISPEQARGDITDDKADIYSVGVVLYEMVTGTLPFEGESAVAVALKQLQEPPKPPTKINEDLPIGLEQIILHAMEKSIRLRYQSAAEMLLDLDELKRNPSIKFDYNYFVDDEPTKFIAKNAVTGKLPQQPEPSAEATADTKEQANRQSRRRSIIIGVSCGAAAAVILVLVFLGIFSGFFTGDRVTVPNFVGKNYYTDVEGNAKYKEFEFEVTYVSSTSAEPGEIINQDKKPGSKTKRGSTIGIDVVSNGTAATVPRINGMSLTRAEETLNAAGFLHFNIVTQSGTKYKPNTVIRSDPPQGTKANTAETLILYVASESDDSEVTVPDFTGLNYAAEKDRVVDYFTSVGLTVGNVEERDSSEPKGTIISQSVTKNSTVPKGTKVDIIISSGRKSKGSATVTVTLPDTNREGTYVLYVNNEAYKRATVICNGGTYSTRLTGSGSSVPVSVYLNGTKLYEGTYDFTKNPASVSNEHRYRIVSVG